LGMNFLEYMAILVYGIINGVCPLFVVSWPIWEMNHQILIHIWRFLLTKLSWSIFQCKHVYILVLWASQGTLINMNPFTRVNIWYTKIMLVQAIKYIINKKWKKLHALLP
jgi:hypothetical protein